MELFSYAAVAGVAAGIAAFSSQVKNALIQLSTLIVQQHHIRGDTLVFSVLQQVEEEWNYMPISGIPLYKSIKLFIKSLREHKNVLFQSKDSRVLLCWRHKKAFVLSFSNDNIDLYSIRGTFDVEQFLQQCINHFEQTTTNKSKSRFRIIKIMGEDKGVMNGAFSPKSEKNDASTPIDSWTTVDLLYYFPSTSYDEHDYREAPSSGQEQEGFFYPSNVDQLFDEAQKWFDLKEWYAERKIPHRRAWLLYGPGGSGKSSIAVVTARKLGIPLYEFQLQTLSDREFQDEWNRVITPAVIVFEDIDTVFHGRENITHHQSLSFQCLLNTISGVQTADGTLLIVTTNHLEHIDPALGLPTEDGQTSTRPGRIDRVEYIGAFDRDCRKQLITHILRDWPDDIEAIVDRTEGMVSAQVQDVCIRHAISKLQTVYDGTTTKLVVSNQ